jgi:disulfide bond formation protein DsbB
MLGIIGLSTDKWKRGLFYLFLAVLSSIILAGYHTGVEMGIFNLSSFCKPLVSISENLSASDFKNMLYSNDMPMCNKPSLFFIGLSMAEWNLILNMTLIVPIIITAVKSK